MDYEIQPESINITYLHRDEERKIASKDRGLIIISCFFIIISVIIFLIQSFNLNAISEVKTCRRIQNNVNRWGNTINDITDSNVITGKQKALQIVTDGFNYQCYDYGIYYLPMKLNNTTYLPEAIRRGNGDGWMIHKSDTIDTSALQFCSYVIVKYNGNTITCGSDMYNKIEYSGWLETGHWCQSALDKVYLKNQL